MLEGFLIGFALTITYYLWPRRTTPEAIRCRSGHRLTASVYRTRCILHTGHEGPHEYGTP